MRVVYFRNYKAWNLNFRRKLRSCLRNVAISKTNFVNATKIFWNTKRVKVVAKKLIPALKNVVTIQNKRSR